MSVRIMAAVWQSTIESATAKIVLLALADAANDEGDCWPHIDTICAKCSLSERSVYEHIKGFQKTGVIGKSKRKLNANQYHIDLRQIPMPPAPDAGTDLRQMQVTPAPRSDTYRTVSEPSVEPTTTAPPKVGSEGVAKGKPEPEKKKHPFAAYHEAFTTAFREHFGEDYLGNGGDWVQGMKILKAKPDLKPEHVVRVAEYHWNREGFVPKGSLSIRGICANWSTLRAQMNGHSTSDDTPQDDERTIARYT